MIRRLSGPQVLTRAEAAQVLGVHPSTVARWASAGSLPCVHTPSGERRYRSNDVEDLLNQRVIGRLNQRVIGQPAPLTELAGQRTVGRIADYVTTHPPGPATGPDLAEETASCQRPATTAEGSMRVPARPQRPR